MRTGQQTRISSSEMNSSMSKSIRNYPGKVFACSATRNDWAVWESIQGEFSTENLIIYHFICEWSTWFIFLTWKYVTKCNVGLWEMAQWLRKLIVLAEYPSSLPSILPGWLTTTLDSRSVSRSIQYLWEAPALTCTYNHIETQIHTHTYN